MKKINFSLVTLTLIGNLGYATVSNASLYSITFDTSSISGGTFSLVLDHFNGDGVLNNSVTVSNFAFGGGSPSGSPTLSGGAAGDLTTIVTLSDTLFFNEFIQNFISGSVLSFDLEATSNFSGGTPDSFTLALLDGTGNPISTSDPLGSDILIALDMDSSSSIQGFSSTNPDYPLPTPQISENIPAIPVPPAAFLFGSGLLGLWSARKKLSFMFAA